eukprot:SAG11_NODE_13530_length_651_cov_0.798913_1_plen_63_part_01
MSQSHDGESFGGEASDQHVNPLASSQSFLAREQAVEAVEAQLWKPVMDPNTGRRYYGAFLLNV